VVENCCSRKDFPLKSQSSRKGLTIVNTREALLLHDVGGVGCVLYSLHDYPHVLYVAPGGSWGD